ncbi:MAG: RNA polymerase sigma factor [Bacteriovorax sp.]
MTLIQANDTQAFDEIYRRFKAPLYSYFNALVNTSQAEEIMQETFIKVLDKRDSFRFESKLKTWIWTIAKNTLRDHWRSVDHKMRHSFDPLTSDSGEEVIESPLDSQLALLLEKTTRQELGFCIDQLPPDQKEIVLLHVQAELSNQEIADLMNISLGAVKSILFRTKDKLAECMKRRGHL